MQHLVQQVEQWALERGLLKPENSFQQLAKTTEELGEVAAALCKKRPGDLPDALGDVAVTLIILAAQNKLDFMECIKKADVAGKIMVLENDPFRQLASINSALGRLSTVLFTDRKWLILHHLGSVAIEVRDLATMCNFDFVDCLETAYNEISGRKGQTVDGVFIKEEAPLHPTTHRRGNPAA